MKVSVNLFQRFRFVVFVPEPEAQRKFLQFDPSTARLSAFDFLYKIL